MSSEVRSKNESLLVFEHSSQELLLKLELVEKDLEEAHMKIKGQTEELDKYQQALQVEKSGGQQEKHKLIELPLHKIWSQALCKHCFPSVPHLLTKRVSAVGRVFYPHILSRLFCHDLQMGNLPNIRSLYYLFKNCQSI